VFVYGIEVNTGAELDWNELEAEDSFAGELCRLSVRLAEDASEWRDFAEDAVSPLAHHAKLGRLMRSNWDELPDRWLKQARELTLGLIHGTGRDEP
jgi:hypothetical protein